jgi:hypothetical protein
LPPVKAFVCHSSIGDAASETLVRALEAGLAPECYCFVDWTELVLGQTWREPINTWLEHCDAGVVVLNDKALKSPFVGYEVSELMRRWRDSNKAFPLIPVHVKHADAARSVDYGKLQTSLLGPWDLHTLDAYQHDPAKDAAGGKAVADIKAQLLAATAQMAPLPAQIRHIITLLKKVPAASVKDTLALADVRVKQLAPITDDELERLTLALRSLGLDGARPLLQLLRGNFKDPDNHWKEFHLREIYDLLALFWVDRPSAATIARVVKGPPAERNLALDADEQETARFYVHRACDKVPADNEWMIAPVTLVGGEELASDDFLVRKIRQVLASKLTTTDKELDADLAAHDEAGNPVFVIVALASLPAARITRLREALKTVTFVFLSRPAVPADDARVRRLIPRLEKADEDAFHARYRKNWKLLMPQTA